VNWKVPGWAAAAGAAISLVAALAGGNPFGPILLRVAVSALVAGALGLAAQYVLRRFLPGTGAASAPPPSVDILLDEEVPLAAQASAEPASAEPAEEELAAEPVESLGDEPGESLGAEPDFTLVEGEAEFAGRRPAIPGYTPAPEPFPGLPEAEQLRGPPDGGLPGAGPSGRSPAAPAPAVEELPSEEGLESLSAADSDELLPGAGEPAVPSHRALKAEELEAQLDSVTKGQDPASLAKAVRTFLRKDQEV
jgi:hypothetical protein